MALAIRTSLTRLTLAWDESTGAFKGGDASWMDRVVDDATDEEVARRERVAEPIAGTLQPGTPLTQLLSATEQERLGSLDREKRRADDAEAKVKELEEEIDRTRPAPAATPRSGRT